MNREEMILDRKLKLLFSKEEIREKVTELASRIGEDYADKDPVLVGVMKGSFVFVSDIVRELDAKAELDFIWTSSYGTKKFSSGEVKIMKDLDVSISGRDVLIIEDIVDTAVTVSFIVEHLKRRNPASLRLASLIDKRETRMVPIEVDYVGFQVERGFLVGYGLDYEQRFRGLPDIYVIEEGGKKAT